MLATSPSWAHQDGQGDCPDLTRALRRQALLIAGLGSAMAGRPAGRVGPMAALAPYLGSIPGQSAGAVRRSCNGDDESNYDYIAGVEVTDFPIFLTASVACAWAKIWHLRPWRAHLDHSPHGQHDLEQWLADSGTGGRRAASSALAKSSMTGPEWAASKSGFRSRRDTGEINSMKDTTRALIRAAGAATAALSLPREAMADGRRAAGPAASP